MFTINGLLDILFSIRLFTGQIAITGNLMITTQYISCSILFTSISVEHRVSRYLTIHTMERAGESHQTRRLHNFPKSSEQINSTELKTKRKNKYKESSSSCLTVRRSALAKILIKSNILILFMPIRQASIPPTVPPIRCIFQSSSNISKGNSS